MSDLKIFCSSLRNWKTAKVVLFLFVSFAPVFWSPVGHTATYTLQDDPASDPLVPPTYTHLFDFTPLITNPSELIDSATLYVNVYDDNDQQAERITLAADGTVILENFKLTNKGSDTLGPFDVLAYVADKQLMLSVQGAAGDFYYDKSIVSVITHVVPISATWLLVGTGLLGLGALGRRRPRKR